MRTKEGRSIHNDVDVNVKQLVHDNSHGRAKLQIDPSIILPNSETLLCWPHSVMLFYIIYVRH